MEDPAFWGRQIQWVASGADAAHRAVAFWNGAWQGGPSDTKTRGGPAPPTLTIMADLVP